jgi:hypothetical protein
MRPHGNNTRPGPLWKRLGWFAVIWIASVAILGVIAYGLKAVIG